MEGNIRQQFIELCRQAYEQDLQTYDCRDIEPLLVQIIQIVKENPQFHNLFVELFLQADKNMFPSPPDLLPFTMRELRFKEIFDAVEQELREGYKNPQFPRRINHLSHLYNAFKDEVWEDAEVWPYYAHETKRKDH